MPREDWARLKDALGETLTLRGAERQRALDALETADADTHARVEEWLQYEAGARGFLAAPAVGTSWERAPLPTLGPGARVGDYRIVRMLGVGGTSIVYEAEQARPRRSVALKVLLQGLRSGDSHRRFEAEAQVLASLNHPGIARVYEAGTAADDRLAFFAMELVEDARDLSRYAREESLPLRARLDLLVDVCDAVGHGHQRGVIHRDLKPANVLVGGDGVPRVIDFGIAKLVSEVDNSAQRTLPGSYLGTLAYMSPEQARGDSVAVDTRSDVYSLGVLAYEVLCGVLPYEIGGRSLVDSLDVILNAAPRRPSSVMGELDADLEAILLKALEKEPERRYSTAGELAADLRRFLQGEPVTARPPSFAYHARLFYRKRRLAVNAVICAVLVVLGSLFMLTATTARVEARERAKAERVKDFLLSTLSLAQPSHATRRDFSARALLDDVAERVDAGLSGAPAAMAEVHATIGGAYRELGLFEPAERHLRRAIDCYLEVAGTDSWEVASFESALASVLLASGQGAAAEEILRKAHASWARSDVPAFFTSIATKKLAEALRQQGQLAEAEPLAREALAVFRASLGPRHRGTAAALHTLSRILQDRGQLEEAAHCASEALSIRLEDDGEGSLSVANARVQLASVEMDSGDAGAVRARLASALSDLERLLPAEHPELLRARAYAVRLDLARF